MMSPDSVNIKACACFGKGCKHVASKYYEAANKDNTLLKQTGEKLYRIRVGLEEIYWFELFSIAAKEVALLSFIY